MFPCTGCGLRPRHLPDPGLPLQAVRRAQGRLRLHADQQRSLRPFLRHHDQQAPGRGQAAEPGVAVRRAAQPWSCTDDLSPTGWGRLENVPVEERRSKFDNEAHIELQGYGKHGVGC